MMKFFLINIIFVFTSVFASSISYIYDENARLTNITNSQDSNISYQYDEVGNRMAFNSTTTLSVTEILQNTYTVDGNNIAINTTFFSNKENSCIQLFWGTTKSNLNNSSQKECLSADVNLADIDFLVNSSENIYYKIVTLVNDVAEEETAIVYVEISSNISTFSIDSDSSYSLEDNVTINLNIEGDYTYIWEIISGPVGSTTYLENYDSTSLNLQDLSEGNYTIRVSVSDGVFESEQEITFSVDKASEPKVPYVSSSNLGLDYTAPIIKFESSYGDTNVIVSVLKEDDLFFVATLYDGIRVYDINKSDPYLISFINDIYPIKKLHKFKDNVLYLSTEDDDFYMIDFSDMLNPNIMNRYELKESGTLNDIEIYQEKIFIATDNALFEYVINENEVLSGYEWSINLVKSLVVKEDEKKLYVTANENYIYTFDIGIDNNISYVGEDYNYEEKIIDIKLVGDKLGYISDYIVDDNNYSSFRIFDINSSGGINYTDSFYVNKNAVTFQVDGNNTYYIQENQINLLDISNMSDIKSTDYITTTKVKLIDFISHKDSRFVVSNKIIQKYSKDINTSKLLGEDQDNLEIVEDIITLGDSYFISKSGFSGIKFFKNSSGLYQWSENFFDINTTIFDIELKDTTLMTANEDENISFIDINDIYNPQIITNYNVSSGYVYKLKTYNEYLFAMEYKGGIEVVDINDILNPAFVTRFDAGNDNIDIDIINDTLVSAGAQGIIKVIDISSPVSLVEISSITLDGNISETAKFNNQLIVSLQGNGLSIVDLVNVNEPIERQRLLETHDIEKLYVNKNLLFVAYEDKLDVYRYIDSFELINQYTFPQNNDITSMYQTGNYLVINSAFGGVESFNIVGETESVLVDTPIIIELSEDIDVSTITDENIILYSINGDRFNIDIVVDGNKITITPTNGYLEVGYYYLVLSENIKTLNGLTLEDDFVYEFEILGTFFSPVFLNNNSFSIDEDGELTFMIDTYRATDNVDYSVFTNASNGSTVINSEGLLKYTPIDDFFGDDTFVLLAKDDNNNTTQQTIMVEVLSKNDIPLADITSHIIEDDLEQVTLEYTVTDKESSYVDLYIEHNTSTDVYSESNRVIYKKISIADKEKDSMYLNFIDDDGGVAVIELSIHINPLHSKNEILIFKNATGSQSYNLTWDENSTVNIDEHSSNLVFDLNITDSEDLNWSLGINNSNSDAVNVEYDSLNYKINIIKQDIVQDSESVIDLNVTFDDGTSLEKSLRVLSEATLDETSDIVIAPIIYLLL